jgi:formate transporter
VLSFLAGGTAGHLLENILEYFFRSPFSFFFLSTAYIAFGGLGSLSITGGITSLDKGVVRLLFAGIFPVGLMLVIIAGADLFTGNVMTMTIGLFARKVSIVSLLRSWVVSFVFNFLGAACVAYLLW